MKIDEKTIKIRNEFFYQKLLPILSSKGFVKSPFINSFGKDNYGTYCYWLSRIRENSIMENLRVEIPRSWNGINIHLNIFKLNPHIEHINQLEGINGLQFYLSPNSNNEMEFDLDDYLIIPLLSYLVLK